MPVVVARDNDGSIAAFENRCAHRGALIGLDNAGNGAKDFQCVYHAWRYDLRGNLQSAAFQRAVKGKGGMPPGFRVADHGLENSVQPRSTASCSGTFSDETPAIEDFIGPGVQARFDRILGRSQNRDYRPLCRGVAEVFDFMVGAAGLEPETR
jgi:hypothetical protein